ncbi:MAG: alanine racemase [Prochlorococcus sp.]|jgi:alanine racemase|nr:alanine racemase [Prochlorococcus sp.]MDP6192774.1 alanine racemase [Prochlorococcaceae cyanobacterium ETNP18_MAG_1]CAI8157445.1 MAG: Alanine racemase 1 [Prochlorococcus marinus str. MIT 9215]
MRNLIATPTDLPRGQSPKVVPQADPRQRAWLEVNPAAIEANAKSLKGWLAKGCQLMAVVKADGYGHGAETVARAALRGGASSLGIATLQEGLELRQAGLDAPILVLGNLSHVEELRACLDWQLIPTLSSMREALLCQNLADGSGRQFNVQLKVDTGMSRLGCDFQSAPRLIEDIGHLNHLNLNGIYSHLAMADGDRHGEAAAITTLQQERFETVLRSIPTTIDHCCRHLANSAGTLRDRNLHYDMVRVGLALYGHNPFDQWDGEIQLHPALAVKARVTLMRDVPAGVAVSYGHRFITKRPSRLAVVSIGYADGVSRALSGRIEALINGQRLPQVGAITMDQLMLDATDHPDINIGSVVTLLGQDGEASITPKEWSNLISESIPWEVLCSFKHRLPRLVT